MIDFSEIGLIKILADFVIVFTAFMAVSDLYTYIKEQKKGLWAIVFASLFVLSFVVSVITGYIGYDRYSLILSLIFLITLFIGVKLKKTMIIFWAVVFASGITLLLTFYHFLVLGGEGKVLAKIQVEKIEGDLIQGKVFYKDETNLFKIKGQMFGAEAYQTVFKPYFILLSGGKERYILTSLFGEIFIDDETGKTYYYPLKDSLISKRDFWRNLEKKNLILPGVEGIQRLQVSVYPKQGKTYYLLSSSQGLILSEVEK